MMLARAEMRRHVGSLALLSAMVAVVACVVLTAASGARRTATVLDRYFAASDVPAALVGVVDPSFASDLPAVEAAASRLGAIEGVHDVGITVGVIADIGTELDFVIEVGVADGPAQPAEATLIAGRAAGTDAPSEVALSELAADELGLGVGDVVEARTIRPETAAALIRGELEELVLDGPVLELEVVGVVRDVDSLAPGGGSSPTGYGSPALISVIEQAAPMVTSFRLYGSPDQAGIDEALAVATDAARESGGEPDVFGGSLDDHVAPVRTAVDSLTTGIVIATAITAAAGLIALAMVISRHLQLLEDERRIATAIGATRWLSTAAVVVPAGCAVVTGVLVGACAAIAASPLFPFSVARPAELDPGVRVEPLVLVAGAVALAVVLVGLVAAFALRRPGPATTRRLTQPGMWARLLRSLPPATAMGLANVIPWAGVRPGRIRSRTAIAGVVIGMAGVVALAVFMASQRDTLGTPDRYGWTWDSSPDVYTGPVEPAALAGELAEHPGLDAVGGFFCDAGLVGDLTAERCAFVAESGSLAPRVLEGRAPAAPGEVALSPTTAAHLDVGIGDRVDLAGASADGESLRMVGVVILPSMVESDDGAVVTGDDLERLTGGPLFETTQPRLLLSYSDGVEPAILEAELEASYPLDFSAYSAPQPPELLVQLNRLRPVLVAMAGFLGGLSAIALVHFLMLSARRRRTEIGVLKAIGFVRRQVASIVAWQGVVLAVIGLAIGIPIGIAVGRSAWRVTVDELDIVATPVTPVLTATALAALVLVGAAAVSTTIGWWSARTSSAEALRSE